MYAKRAIGKLPPERYTPAEKMPENVARGVLILAMSVLLS